MLRFSLIQAGLIEISSTEGVKDSRPTSSLLCHDDFKIVIDTEHPKEDGAEYVAAFKRLGLAPQAVDAVIFTHLHPDHFGHKHLFPRAAFLFHKDERMGFYFKNDRKVVLQGDALLDLNAAGIGQPEYVSGDPDLHRLGDRIYVRHAPGHTPGSIMIFATISARVHAWVGDTFLNQSYFAEWKPPGSSWDQRRVYEHMTYARDAADLIVPGHGLPFSTRT